MTIETVLQTASRADYGFKNIPIIDMKDMDDANPAVRQQLANDIRDACINVGFFYVKGHGIPEESIYGALEVGKKFFALPEETKLKYDSRNTTNFKGYTAFLSENIDPENRGDLHEGFDVCPEGSDSEKSHSTTAIYGPNQWPTAEIPEFKEAYMSYYNAAVAFGLKLFPLFAIALGVHETFFDDKTKEAAAVMRILHYPPQTGPHDDRLMGIGAHTDFECFTILWQEPGVEALQVLNANKEWISATPVPGTLVVNIGDQFQRWTNDVFKSTVHRAINRSSIERHSMPVFFGADYSVKLEPIPSCVSSEYPSKYEVVSAGDYSNARLAAAYGKQ